jgi:hypothetical protein
LNKLLAQLLAELSMSLYKGLSEDTMVAVSLPPIVFGDESEPKMLN